VHVLLLHIQCFYFILTSRFSEGYLFSLLFIAALTITEREPAKYSIISKSDLDRETVHLYNLTLGCNVISEDDHSVAGDAESFWIPGTLTVLDQNDSPVRREDGSQYQVVYISLSSTDNDFQRVLVNGFLLCLCKGSRENDVWSLSFRTGHQAHFF